MSNYKKIGIIGGMGPESTALLYQQIVRTFQSKFRAYNDQDFPEMLIHNLPIPNITLDVKHEDIVKKMLSKSVHFLETSGSDLIAFPCNSLNYFVDYLCTRTDIPIISIVEETSRVISKKNISEILLLSTPTTFEKGLYQRYLNNTRVVRPLDYTRILNIIVQTLKGERPTKDFENIIEKDYSNYEQIVIGCTDLSLLINNYNFDNLIDSTKCLANAVCEACIN